MKRHLRRTSVPGACRERLQRLTNSPWFPSGAIGIPSATYSATREKRKIRSSNERRTTSFILTWDFAWPLELPLLCHLPHFGADRSWGPAAPSPDTSWDSEGPRSGTASDVALRRLIAQKKTRPMELMRNLLRNIRHRRWNLRQSDSAFK